MTMLTDAVEAILATYGDPERIARDYAGLIPNADIVAALKAAERGSGQAYALELLAGTNPPKVATVKAAPEPTDD